MSHLITLVKDDERINVAHVHAYYGKAVVFNTQLVKINQSLDNLFLRLCEFVNAGWEILGDYRPNGFNPLEALEYFKSCKADPRDLEWYGNHDEFLVAKDGTHWDNLSNVC